jgi:hypothetical protein
VTILRSIFFIIALLSQALPVQAVMMSENKSLVCEMGCCAALAEAGLGGCDCDATPTAPEQRDSPSLPASRGTELIPVVLWDPFHEVRPPLSRDARPAQRSGLCFEDHPIQSHVRLAVLFCSFLQ